MKTIKHYSLHNWISLTALVSYIMVHRTVYSLSINHILNYNNLHSTQMSRLFRQPLGLSRDSNLNLPNSHVQPDSYKIGKTLTWLRNSHNKRSVSSPPVSHEVKREPENNRSFNLKRKDLTSIFASLRLDEECFSIERSLTDGRAVVFSRVPCTISPAAFLAQASGGPLEKVEAVLRKNHKSTYALKLSYMTEESAVKFSEYAATGRFLVNGRALIPDKPSRKAFNSKVDSHSNALQYMMKHRIRRVLVLKARKDFKDPIDSRLISIEHIRLTFSAFGVIINISPMISSKAEIRIHYADVRSAIQAKRTFEYGSDPLYREYAKNGWWISYAEDPVDNNVPASL